MKTTTSNPIITGEEQDGKIIHIKFVDGNNYILQHPGNRTKLRWEKDCYTLTGMDHEKFLDLAMEHCVFPNGHDSKPSIDSVKPKEMEVWQRLLRRFLDGDIEEMVARSAEGTNSGRNLPASKSQGQS